MVNNHEGAKVYYESQPWGSVGGELCPHASLKYLTYIALDGKLGKYRLQNNFVYTLKAKINHCNQKTILR